MLTSLSKKLNQKNTLIVLLGLLVLVTFLPNVTYANLLESFLWGLVNRVFGWMVWLSGMLLDYSINSMVVGFGEMYATSGLGLTIDTLWVTVRDIFNLTFIFGLVFIGLRMIFGSDSNTKKLLVSIILAALLVNFSLFITKFVVDFSNIAAVQLVNAFPKDASGVPSVSGEFMKLMGLTSVLNFTSGAGADFSNMTGVGSIGYIFGTMFLYIITAFVFFAGALLLIIRFVVLNIYMVLSPFMFIGWVFPSMEKYSKEYWSGFLSRCFVAPAYLLMIYFSSKVLVSFSVTGGGGANSLSTMFTKAAPASFAAVFPPFILTAIFLIAAIVVAQKMSATGGSAVISFQDKMMKKTRSAVQGAAMISGRIVTKPIRDGAKKGSSYIGGKATQQINTWQAKAHAKASASPAGPAGWGAKAVGWVTTNNATDKTARAATAWVTNTEWGTGTTQKAAEEYNQKTKNRAEERAKVMAGNDPTNVSELARLRKQDKDFRAGAVGVVDLDSNEKANLIRLEKIEKEMQSAVADMAISSLEEMSAKELENIAKYLTSAQTDKVMGSDKISSETKGKIGKARYKAIEDAVGTAGSVLSAELTKLSIEQIESMGDIWINDNAHLFSNTQMDDLKKSKKYTESQKSNFVGTRKTRHQNATDLGSTSFDISSSDPVTGAPTPKNVTLTTRELFFNTSTSGMNSKDRRKPAEVANLDSKVLTSDKIVQYLTKDILEVIGDKKTLSQADRDTIADNIYQSSPSAERTKLVEYLGSSQGVRNWNVKPPANQTGGGPTIIVPLNVGGGPRPRQP